MDIRLDMMRLWKETFHDSDRYIRLVFDSYYAPANISVRYDGDRLVAALIGVPYCFRDSTLLPDKNVDRESPQSGRMMRGLYLCGLATRPEYRRQGIMADMMDEIQRRAAERHFDFTFLIPADSHLREYYRRKGYFDFSRREDSKIRMSRIPGEFRPRMVRSLFEADDEVAVRRLAAWCVEREEESANPVMLHSVSDMVTVMAENENVIFFTDCASGREYPNLENIVAVAFPTDLEDKLADEMLISRPDLVSSLSFRRIFAKSRGECSVFEGAIRKFDVGPYAMAHLLPGCQLTPSSFPDFSVSLLLD